MGGNDLVVKISPLGFAAANGNIEMVELLIENKAHINATTVRNITHFFDYVYIMNVSWMDV